MDLKEYEIRNAAYNMYDGGWRASDRFEIAEEYQDITEQELDWLCDELMKIESSIREVA